MSRGAAFLSGVLAGTVSIAVMYSLRVAQLGVFVPEQAVGALVNAIPGNLESFFVVRMGELAKYTALVVATLVYLVIHGAYGLAVPAIQRYSVRRSVSVGAFALIPAAFDLLVFMPLFGAGLLGTAAAAGWVGASVNTAVSSLVYSGTLLFVAADFRVSYPERLKVSRRTFVKSVVALVVGLAVVVYGLDTLVLGPPRTGYRTIAELFANEITPNEEFYVVTKNLIDPTIDAGGWSLKIDGEVGSPLKLSYQELLARQQTDLYVTFECVSNEVGGGLISNAKWSGIQLSALLSEAGAAQDAGYCVFACEDGYTEGIPVAKALDSRTILALSMNGQPLPKSHGFPVRVVVPGLYGMFSAKWVNRITLVKGEYEGFWQQKGWTNSGEINTTAIIRVPKDSSVSGPTVSIGGVAFAGVRGVSRVEVSTDGGTSWNAAVLKPPLSTTSWILWEYAWNPSRTGRYRVVARAYDGGGTLQDARSAPPYPNGASGYDAIDLDVSL
jgi:DMSO/TMAO reductase YedYZ molybdopterin-dependent catalytic subunit